VERSHVVIDMPVVPTCSGPGRRRRASADLRAAEEKSVCQLCINQFYYLNNYKYF